jgi:hypothetical protein
MQGKKNAIWRILFLLFFACFPAANYLFAQETPPVTPEQPSTTVEQQLENITENNEDLETEDDSYLQELAQFIKDPVNLNTADANLLKELKALSALQIQNLIMYRQVLGKLNSIYELQAVPGWDVQTIKRIRPYIVVSNAISTSEDLGQRLKKGEHSILIRATQVLEKSKGYLVDPSTTNNFYPGSPQKLLFRYKYVYKNLLQYGVLGEKDAGEQFFKGGQKQGFDFYSAHIFLRRLGIIKSLALGDFTVNMGQGLTQWQSLAFKKGPDISAIKRQSSVLRPYNSAGEIFFHRGVGITVGRRNWEITAFGSYRNLDANFIAADTLQQTEALISSLQTSGYHRTNSELADKAVQQQIAFGGNAAVQLKRLHLGLNAIHYDFKLPLQKAADPYNRYALSGKSFGNYSVDYSITYRNLHFFGEAATNATGGNAFVNGVLISAANTVDISMLYRNIGPKYQSLYTNAFTESTYPTNEKGLFTGISIRPSTGWQIDGYFDFYRFPWLRYRVNAPTSGSDYFVQLSYRPNRTFEVYSRYKRENKAINFNPDDLTLSPVVAQPKQDWRTQFSFKMSPPFTFRNRTEMIWYDRKEGADSKGFLIYTDLIYRPLMKPFSANVRLQYFQTDDYNSRLYAYESDVLFSYSIPVFYEKGYRYYVNLNYDLTRKLTIYLRWAQTISPERSSVGSGLDEIQGHNRTEVKAQLYWRF